MERIADDKIPKGKHRCPVCDGTGVRDLTDVEKQYSWNKGRTTTSCSNCGGQYMFGHSRGYVNANKEGTGCTHKYIGNRLRMCLEEYVCEHCGDRFEIDSSD